MPELELALRELGRQVEFPPTPDLASTVRQRLGAAPRRRFALPRRRALAVAFAILAVAVGAVMAVPPARTAVLEWLGLKGVTVVRVEKLPEAPLTSEGGLGEPVTLAEARRRAPWLVEPHDEGVGTPDEIYMSSEVPGGQVTFIWGTTQNARLLMTQSPGTAFAEKMLQPESKTERTDVDGAPGIWFFGEEHFFVFRDRNGDLQEGTGRLVGNTLLWQLGDLTVRLEGDLSKEQALEIARSVRP
jgi:hypothetical protein